MERSESEHVTVSNPTDTQDETQYGMHQNEFNVDEMTKTNNDLKKKERKIFVGFINDLNTPQIIERKYLKNQEKDFESKDIMDTKPNKTVNNSNNPNIKKLQVKYSDDLNIPLIEGKNRKKLEKKRKIKDLPKSGKIVKVNIIDDAQINLIQNLKRK